MENNNRAGHAQINARGDCVDLAGAGSGRRNENPAAWAAGSVNRSGECDVPPCGTCFLPCEAREDHD